MTALHQSACGARRDVYKKTEERTPLCSEDDMKSLVLFWDRMRSARFAPPSKPVLVMMGKAGVGKSSVVKAMLPTMDDEQRAELKICCGGRQGSGPKPVRVEGDHVVCLDVRGKLEEENVKEYAAHVNGILQENNDADNVAFIIGVLGYEPTRDNDVDSLYESVKTVCTEVNRPFIILAQPVRSVDHLVQRPGPHRPAHQTVPRKVCQGDRQTGRGPRQDQNQIGGIAFSRSL